MKIIPDARKIKLVDKVVCEKDKLTPNVAFIRVFLIMKIMIIIMILALVLINEMQSDISIDRKINYF